MTPKEKALELVNKYKSLYNYSSYAYPICESTAKECALIAVDEAWALVESSKQFNYWSEVKEEIEKI